ncbi:MAG: bifunctional UDP-N-acetylglucosamine diphosphorylase/glucosamine-1-phosphate N-acetyltransferase GlmU [Thiopseudomonas sp.]|nr:bifunctional UDP-N-acetylglucosamine diphosphorylase/glucosamine-1-phosphate N-acetyltransferase GlmU [Thiopseudomonas sp.]
MSLDIVILAAGQGTRMRSSQPKVLHPIAGKPMLAHVIDAARALQPNSIQVVIGHGAELVKQQLAADDVSFVMQTEQLGTGHAVAQAIPNLSANKVLVLYGDVPLIQASTLKSLLQGVAENKMALLTVNLSDPAGYGRIVRDTQQQVTAIVEHKDATLQQLEICEGNTGILAASRSNMVRWLGRLSNNNAQAEYYLTDIIAMAVADQVTVTTETATQPMEVQGVNDRQQLARLERFYQSLQAQALMAQGVTLLDPSRIDVRGAVKVGRDITIDINVIFEGNVEIEDNVRIGANTIIKNSILRAGAVIKANCHIEDSEIGPGADCGPFARLRPGTKLGKNAHVGNFVELKNACLGEAAKVGHLTYLGDSEIGARTNIGAGTITCNYDGANKHRTVMGEDVFIGSNSSIVAPITIGNAATTGAGSTITQDVPALALAVGRAKQRNIENWPRPQKKV